MGMTRTEKKRSSLRGASVEVLMGTATEMVTKAQQSSSLFNPIAEDRIPRFESKELNLGHVVGRGGFCAVRELNGIKLNDASGFSKYPSSVISDVSFVSDDDDILNRDDFAKRVKKSKKSKKQDGRYVVKQVSDEIRMNKNDRKTFLKGIVDLWIESKFLASLNHPNIIKLRGMSLSPSVSNDDELFIILDGLKETFATKLKSWMHKERQTKGVTGFFTGGQQKVEQLLDDRLQAAYDVADAMSYLHSKNIIFRDLKPDNIGFDYKGNLKLFDFGLAKELLREQRDSEGLYHLTGFTGAVRYMAPEVGLGKRYNQMADVYSWSILMWYIMALEPPFAYFTKDMFEERVFRRGTRPVIKPGWSPNMAFLLKDCWSSDISCRPDFHDIKDILRLELHSKPKSKPNKLDSSQHTLQTDNGSSELISK